jgi:hypothetical protein
MYKTSYPPERRLPHDTLSISIIVYDTGEKPLDVNERYGWAEKWVIMIDNRGGMVHMWASVLSVSGLLCLEHLGGEKSFA